MYVAFPSPHAPIIPIDSFDELSGAGAYGDFVVQTDDACGKILDALKEVDLENDTVVMFSADNGPETYAYPRDEAYGHWSSEPFRGLKRDLYEGGHHVPMIIRLPGVTVPRSESKALVSQIDLMGTLASWLDVELPKNAAGDSYHLLPVLLGESQSVRDTLVHNTNKDRSGIRYQRWLLIQGPDGYHSRRDEEWEKKRDYPKDNDSEWELYDLLEDPGQRNDLATQEPKKVKELAARLDQVRISASTAPRLR